MAPPRIYIDPEILARARALFENGAPLDELGRLMGVSGQTVRNRAVELGWSRMRQARPVEEEWPEPPPPLREPAPEDAEPDALAARLSRMVAREMMRAETYNHSPEAAARTLAVLAKTVSTIREIHTTPAQVPALEDGPDLETLRLDLARRLTALVAEHEERELRKQADEPPFRW